MGLTALLILIFQFYLVLTVFVLLLDNREPAETFAWIFIFLLMPGFGFVVYLIFARNWRKSYNERSRISQGISKSFFNVFKPLKDAQEEKMSAIHQGVDTAEDDLYRLLYKNSHALLTTGNEIEIFHEGRPKFEALKADLRNAQKFIHMQYFIWHSDELGQEIKDILLEKSAQGVEIRILYDYSGSFFKLSRSYVSELRNAGIKIYPFFNYLSELKLHTINYRNHRKIVNIDGEIGYMGGMNLGQDYIDGGKKFDFWRDTHLRIEGEGVALLQAVFAIDWFNTTSQKIIFNEKYYPLVLKEERSASPVAMQIPTSGFDSPWPAILHSYFCMITMAQKNLYLSSPYFIPEQGIVMALKTAAMRGVNVVILMTGVVDHHLPYWAAFSYFDELLRAGVKIFHYQKGFFHGKVLSCDESICSIGTANMDIRSFRLNYEINAVIYNKQVVAEVDEQFKKDLSDSREFTLSDFNQLSLPVRLRNSLARLISPIL